MSTSTKGVFLFTSVALILGAVFDWLFWDGGIGLNFPLYVALVILSGLLLSRHYARPLTRTTGSILVTAFLFSVMTFVHASPLLTFFNMVGTVLLFLLFVRLYTGVELKDLVPEQYLRTLFLPFAFIRPFFDAAFEILALRKVGAAHPYARQVIRGTVLALIAVGVFSWLFASADLVFAQFFNSLFSFTLDAEIVRHLAVFAFVAAFFMGAFGYMFQRIYVPQNELDATKERMFGVIEMTILFGAIDLLFFGFILVQIAYLFGGESHLIAQGITYAEYARTGFLELVTVSIFAYLVIAIAESQIIKKGGEHLDSFKWLSGILVIEVVAILFSAWTRLALYDEAYGFSTIRLYSHALMVWIGIMLVLLLYHILVSDSRAKFALRAFVSAAVMLIAMNILNPDAFIAQQNLARYAETGKIDSAYLATLSDDAIPYTIVLFDDKDPNVRDPFVREVDSKPDPETVGNSAWKSLTLSRMRAEALLAKHEVSLPIGYTRSAYTVAEKLPVSCNGDTDCETPGEYLVRSNCPYTTMCIEHSCTVVCPDYAGR